MLQYDCHQSHVVCILKIYLSFRGDHDIFWMPVTNSKHKSGHTVACTWSLEHINGMLVSEIRKIYTVSWVWYLKDWPLNCRWINTYEVENQRYIVQLKKKTKQNYTVLKTECWCWLSRSTLILEVQYKMLWQAGLSYTSSNLQWLLSVQGELGDDSNEKAVFPISEDLNDQYYCWGCQWWFLKTV